MRDHGLFAVGEGRATKATSTWVPSSTRLSLRTCGKAPSPRGPAEGRAKAAALAAQSGTSKTCRRRPSAAIPGKSRRAFRAGPGGERLVEQGAHRRHAQPLAGDERLDRWGDSSPTRSRRACLKTCRIGNSVKNPMASTTQQTTSCVNRQRRELSRR